MKPSDLLLLATMRRALTDGTARAIRLASRLTQAEVAHAVGVSPDAVSLWERGLRSPSGRSALRYARLLGHLHDSLGRVA